MQDFLNKIQWNPIIGDPTIMGWVTVVSYFFCFIISLAVAVSAERLFEKPIVRQRYLWWFISLVMLCLGINKQLDLQTLFTVSLKYLSQEQGWYDNRRFYQKAFIIFSIILSVAFSAALTTTYLSVIKKHLLAILGLCLLILFILLRASSFHHMDIFIGLRFLGLKMNWIFELLGIFLVTLNAMILLRAKSVGHSTK